MSCSSSHVLVLGAGIVGIACAHCLRRAGLQVTLIDRAEPGQACSFGNCGPICPSHILPLTVPGAVSKALRSLFDEQTTFRIKPQGWDSLPIVGWPRRLANAVIAAGHSILGMTLAPATGDWSPTSSWSAPRSSTRAPARQIASHELGRC